MTVKLKVKPLHAKFKMPKQAHPGDACFDIAYCGDEDILIPRGHRRMIPCGFALDIPQGYEVQVRSRSGLAAKQGIAVLNSPGTIDSGYKGEIKVVLYNSDISDFIIEPGDRIAQLAVKEVPIVDLELTQNLEDSDRGSGGFGSTGVK